MRLSTNLNLAELMLVSVSWASCTAEYFACLGVRGPLCMGGAVKQQLVMQNGTSSHPCFRLGAQQYCHDGLSAQQHRPLILRDNVHDARMDPSCGNWAAGVDKMYSSLGMQSPFLGPAGVGAVDPHTFRRNMGDAYKRNWAGLHDSPRTDPLLAQNLARICAGLLGQARCLQSPILSFASRFPSSGD